MRSLFIAIGLAAGFAAGPAGAAVITNPDWEQRPNGEDLAQAYPMLASAMSVEGRATIACRISVEGVLQECRVVSEAPAGLGFGRAALSMSRYFRMRPMMRDGRPVGGGTVRIPIAFRLPARPAPRRTVEPRPPTSAEALELGLRLARAHAVSDGLLSQVRSGGQQALWKAYGVSAAIQADARAAVEAAARAAAPAMEEGAARYYASRYSAADLRVMLAYAESPAGQATVARAADLTAMNRSLGWITYRMMESLARGEFCRTRECEPSKDFDATVKSETEVNVLEPAWIQRPTRSQVEVARPRLAQVFGLEGAVRLRCTANATGLLTRCEVLAEAPAGLGFGAAAIELARSYRMQPPPPGALDGPASTMLTIRVPAPTRAFPSETMTPQLGGAPSLERLALAKRVVDTAGAGVELTAEAERGLKQFDELELPGVSAETRKAARSALYNAAIVSADTWRSMSAAKYATLFDEEILKAMLVYEQSPVGRAERANTLDQAEYIAALWERIGGELAEDAHLRFCARRRCSIAR